MNRPYPPVELREPGEDFAPAYDLLDWISSTFIGEDATLRNPAHEHLQSAQIGCLWTSVPNTRQGRSVAGQAEMPMPRGSRWQVARQEMQLRQWFGDIPHFLITIYAPAVMDYDDASWCALVEHELYHCGQAFDEHGCARYKKDGSPVFAIRGHDVEEFIGVVERYGAGAASDGVAEIARAASAPPAIGRHGISTACGTCQLRLA